MLALLRVARVEGFAGSSVWAGFGCGFSFSRGVILTLLLGAAARLAGAAGVIAVARVRGAIFFVVFG